MIRINKTIERQNSKKQRLINKSQDGEKQQT